MPALPEIDALSIAGTISDDDLQARNAAAIALLERLSAPSPEDGQAQRETLTYLVKALDDDRADGRKLFPDATTTVRPAPARGRKP